MNKPPDVVKVRTWFGLIAVADVRPGHWHRAGYGDMLITHPPVVNLLLRRGLPREHYQTLSALHEIGHLQMLPLELLYAALLYGLLFVYGQPSILTLILVFISCFAAWEMFAESHVIRHSVKRYGHYYTAISVLPRVIFWGTTTILQVMGWMIVLGLT
ncbi:MAG: hypothetical protein ACC707_08965 [Thiohalomonadales bacterium]